LGFPIAGPDVAIAEKLRALYLADPDPALGELLTLINEGWVQ